MNTILTHVRSLMLSWLLSWQRQLDHTYRYIIGVPILRYSEISPQLYLGGQYSTRGYRILENRGITGIVSMRTHARANLPNLRQVEMLHLPTKDQHAPTLEQLQKGVEFISRHLKKGGKVYIHCAFGEGRGPTMMAAYLMSTGMTMEDALTQIIKVRGFIRPSRAQYQRLREFEKQITHKH